MAIILYGVITGGKSVAPFYKDEFTIGQRLELANKMTDWIASGKTWGEVEDNYEMKWEGSNYRLSTSSLE